ncbi:MAG: metallophosphoesterase [Treponema sp.]
MKILCISDQIDPLIYSVNIKKRYNDVDFVISAGDLSMEYLEFIVSSLNKPLFFVFGNHNLEALPYYHKTASNTDLHSLNKKENQGYGSTYLGFTTRKEGNVLLAGVSGSIRYNNGLCQYTERQMLLHLLALVPRLLYNKIRYGRYVDIFVAHASPRGIHDREDPCHKGFKCFLWFIKIFKPKYFLHGHIHLYDMQDKRVTQYGQTTIINVFSNYILHTD